MDELTVREMGRKYEGTCGMIQIKGEDKPTPVTFLSVGQDDDNAYYFHVFTKQAKQSRENKIKGISLGLNDVRVPLHKLTILPMPDRQVFDYNGMTYVYSRHPARQYQKGVCQANTSLTSPVQRMLDETLPNKTATYEVTARSRNNRVGLEFMYNLFDPTYADSLTEALEDIDNLKLMSRALSKEYFISLFPDENNSYILFRLEVPVAYFNRNKDVFTVIDKVYEQELKDFCRRHNINSQIEV